ncbi:NTP transferase domain-containing protein [Paenibacillus sp. MWE-103]|uniref:NTP transferase domain-containing protein n=1 Tax=Paenibacillus artemisiicola TaxID=1172618 RepID=A0ABS3WC55_9BACL|nr:sugar phosphate nucleotidyltransferase [Paenibacillus artemisiicola]MBO7745897.1 NTP transferase domain-containing protein [Paenibacillus artemisiicola]
MKAVIMAGGKGTRLRPLTSNTPKPMVPLLDRPVMEYTIELLKKHGIADIAVTVQYIPEAIRQYFGDGSDFGVRLHYFEEHSPLGTAGSVKNAEAFLDETFIVISGDALTDFDLTRAIAYHREKEAVATLVLTQVDSPLEFGVVMTDPAGRIVRFLEKPSWGEVFSDTVNTGIYILDTEIFGYMESGREVDFSKDLFPALMKRGRPMYGYVAEGYWSDIGNLGQYRQTQFDMLEGKVDVAIAGREVAPGVWAGEHALIDPTASVIGPAFIGDHASVGRGASVSAHSVVGAGSILMDGVALDRAVLWRNNVLDRQVEIVGATLCRNVLAGYGASVKEGAVLGDHCSIGVNSIVQPGVKIFPDKSVEDNAVLKHSLIVEERAAKTIFGRRGVKGVCNVTMTTGFVDRLATALASSLAMGSTVGIGRDAAPFAELIADTFATVLHASGIHTYDFGAVTSSITRYATRHLDCAAGIYIRVSDADDEDQLVIEFLDGQGLPIPKAAERKIENAFVQEDRRLIKRDKLGRKRTSPHAGALYRKDLLESVDAGLVAKRSFKVVTVYNGQNLNQVLPELLHELGCRVIQLNGVVSTAAELARWVRDNEADFGVLLDANGERLELVTERGGVASDELLHMLQLMIRLRTSADETVRVPVHFPGTAELLAERQGRRAVRSKADTRSLLESCQHNGFHAYADGIYTVVHAMAMLAELGLSLSQLVATIPSFALFKEEVDCPWTEKGKVMRFLMEETKGQDVEMIDGLKIFHDQGWTLILPDNEEPIFQVYTNAESQQAARELAAAYADKIRHYRNG